MGVSVSCPIPGQAAAVLVDGGNGYLCVTGTVGVSLQHLPPKTLGQYLLSLLQCLIELFTGPAKTAAPIVKVQVWSGVLSPPLPDPTSPTAALVTGTSWTCSRAPAPCWAAPPGPYPSMTVVAYQYDSSGTTIVDRCGVVCCGRQASDVDCGSGPIVMCPGSGSGSGSGSGGPTPVPSSGGPRAAVTFAPARWRLPITDFPTPTEGDFNGDWLLVLRDARGLAGVWDNGGDGARVPRIELWSEAPPDASWRLRLRFGAVVLEYTAAPLWEVLGPLTLTADVAAPLPRALTALPA